MLGPKHSITVRRNENMKYFDKNIENVPRFYWKNDVCYNFYRNNVP